MAADTPAARKVSQFLDYKADLGYNIMLLQEIGTTGASGQMNYYTPTPSAGRSSMRGKESGQRI